MPGMGSTTLDSSDRLQEGFRHGWAQGDLDCIGGAASAERIYQYIKALIWGTDWHGGGSWRKLRIWNHTRDKTRRPKKSTIIQLGARERDEDDDDGDDGDAGDDDHYDGAASDDDGDDDGDDGGAGGDDDMLRNFQIKHWDQNSIATLIGP